MPRESIRTFTAERIFTDILCALRESSQNFPKIIWKRYNRDCIGKAGTQSESGCVSYKTFAVIIPLGKNIDTQRVNSGLLFFIILLSFKQDIDMGF